MTKPGVKSILLISLLIAGMVCWLMPRSTNKPIFTSSVFEAGNGWGYDIRVNDSLLIHQDVIPALPVNSGFANKEQAEAAASLVIRKLRKKQYPSLSAEEIKQIITRTTHE